MKKRQPFQPQVLKVEGDPEVAEVAISRLRPEERFTVETVDGLAPPLSRREKWIINVSTQFGCPVGCPFCDAALDFAGNLTAEEMLWQVKWALGRHPGEERDCQKLKVHFARMGEPALNDAVLEALERLPVLIDCRGLWGCVATIFPRGRGGWFERLFALKDRLFLGRFQLQFSVQSTDENVRRRLIPMPHASLAELAKWGQRFFRPGDRKVVLNFALARDVPFEPEKLSALFDPGSFALKLTPVNPTAAGARSGFRSVLRTEQAAVLEHACERLQASGFDVVLSVGDEREDRVGSNCGQAARVLRGLWATDDASRRGRHTTATP